MWKKLQQQKYKYSTYIESIEGEFGKVKENLGVVGEILEGLRGKLYFPGSDNSTEE